MSYPELDDWGRDALDAACRPHAGEYLRRGLLWLRSWHLAEQPRVKSYEVRDYRSPANVAPSSRARD